MLINYESWIEEWCWNVVLVVIAQLDSTQLDGFLLIESVRNGSLEDSLMFSLFYFFEFHYMYHVRLLIFFIFLFTYSFFLKMSIL